MRHLAPTRGCSHHPQATRKHEVAPHTLVGNDPSRPTGGSVRKGVPDLGPEAPRAPDGGPRSEKIFSI